MGDITFGQWLRWRRKLVGWSQDQLAEKLKGANVVVSGRAISKWEKGICNPRPEKLEALLDKVFLLPEDQQRRVKMAMDGWDTFPPITHAA